MYTEIPTNGDVITAVALLLLMAIGLAICIGHYGSTSRISDMSAWSRNYERSQRRTKVR